MSCSLPVILVVDDDPVETKVCQHALDSERFKVVAIDDGINIVKALSTYSPDVIIMDVEMPGLAGDYAARAVPLFATARHQRDVPVILRSGVYPEKLKQIALDIGAADALTKDASADEIVASVERALSLRGSTRAVATGSD